MTSGVLALVASVPAITFMTMAARQALDDGTGALAIVVGQLVLGGALALVFYPLAPRPARGWATSWRSIVIGPLLAAGVLLTIAGLERLPAGLVVVLIFAAPVWIALYDLIVRHNPPTAGTVGSLAVVLLGLTVMVDPLSLSLDGAGLAYGLLTSVVTAVMIIVLEGAQEADGVAASTRTALLSGGLTGIALGALAGGTALDLESNLPEVLVCGVGLTAWFVLFSVGLRATSALTAALIAALEPVVVAAVAYLYFDETLAPHELAGAGLLLVGVIAASRGEASRVPLREGSAPSARST